MALRSSHTNERSPIDNTYKAGFDNSGSYQPVKTIEYTSENHDVKSLTRAMLNSRGESSQTKGGTTGYSNKMANTQYELLRLDERMSAAKYHVPSTGNGQPAKFAQIPSRHQNTVVQPEKYMPHLIPSIGKGYPKRLSALLSQHHAQHLVDPLAEESRETDALIQRADMALEIKEQREQVVKMAKQLAAQQMTHTTKLSQKKSKKHQVSPRNKEGKSNVFGTGKYQKETSPYKQPLPQVQAVTSCGFTMGNGLEALLLARQRSNEYLRQEKSISKLTGNRDVVAALAANSVSASTSYQQTDVRNMDSEFNKAYNVGFANRPQQQRNTGARTDVKKKSKGNSINQSKGARNLRIDDDLLNSKQQSRKIQHSTSNASLQLKAHSTQQKFLNSCNVNMKESSTIGGGENIVNTDKKSHRKQIQNQTYYVMSHQPKRQQTQLTGAIGSITTNDELDQAPYMDNRKEDAKMLKDQYKEKKESPQINSRASSEYQSLAQQNFNRQSSHIQVFRTTGVVTLNNQQDPGNLPIIGNECPPSNHDYIELKPVGTDKAVPLSVIDKDYYSQKKRYMELQSKIQKIKTDAGERKTKKEMSPAQQRNVRIKSNSKKSQHQIGEKETTVLPLVATQLPPVQAQEPVSGSLMSEGKKHIGGAKLSDALPMGGRVGHSILHASHHNKFPSGKTELEHNQNMRKHGSQISRYTSSNANMKDRESQFNVRSQHADELPQQQSLGPTRFAGSLNGGYMKPIDVHKRNTLQMLDGKQNLLERLANPAALVKSANLRALNQNTDRNGTHSSQLSLEQMEQGAIQIQNNQLSIAQPATTVSERTTVRKGAQVPPINGQARPSQKTIDHTDDNSQLKVKYYIASIKSETEINDTQSHGNKESLKDQQNSLLDKNGKVLGGSTLTANLGLASPRKPLQIKTFQRGEDLLLPVPDTQLQSQESHHVTIHQPEEIMSPAEWDDDADYVLDYDAETFDLSKSVNQSLCEDEVKMYGALGKCPKGYKKLNLLGKGGCAVVWLCKDLKTNEKVAIKQFPKCQRNEINYKSGRSELQFNKKFFSLDGHSVPDLEGHPGLRSLCKMINVVEDKNDLWLVFELCGQPLSKILFQTKGQFFKGERIYEVQQDMRICKILERNGCKEFKKIIKRILEGLSLLQVIGLIHADLKTENILVSFDYRKKIVSSVKIIDFGASFDAENVNKDVEITTPEYLPPEILEFVDFRMMNMVGFNPKQQEMLNVKKKLKPWSIDIWSLGVILLEIVIGFPIWMSYKGRIVKGKNSMQSLMTGTFGVQGRVPSKISKLQHQVASDLPKFFKQKQFKQNICLGNMHNNKEFMQFLQHLLTLNPKQRSCPTDLLEHNFLQ